MKHDAPSSTPLTQIEEQGPRPDVGSVPRGRITDDLVKAVAEAADCDCRTVLRRLAGLPVKGRVSARVDRELAARVPALPLRPSAA